MLLKDVKNIKEVTLNGNDLTLEELIAIVAEETDVNMCTVCCVLNAALEVLEEMADEEE